MLLQFILQVSNFRLHADVRSLYTPMYRYYTPWCTDVVHQGVYEVLQRANYNNVSPYKNKQSNQYVITLFILI